MSRRDIQARSRLLDAIPCGVAVIDRSLRIVDANTAFAEMFGKGPGAPCYEITRGKKTPCPDCPALATFEDGAQRVIEQTGKDRQGRTVYYLVQTIPLRDEKGDIDTVASITTDLTPTKRLQREYQTLFENVPCYVAVINGDYRVVKANAQFRRVFGEPTGQHCYELLKRRRDRCADCPAEKTFADAETHTSAHVGVSCDGVPTHYVVSTAPLNRGDGRPSHVIEMALDVSNVRALEEELRVADQLRAALVEASPDAIVVLDERARVKLFNPAAEALWERSRDRLLGHRLADGMLPGPVRKLLAGEQDGFVLNAASVTNAGGEAVPVRATGVTLRSDGKVMGAAFVLQDQRELARLEREKLEAERLAAVGQTVAGLAHGIKNVLTGLEGGMYVTSTGLTKGDNDRVRQGWQMLERNIGKISALVRNLLAFSRGDVARPKQIDPCVITREVFELFRDSAAQHGIDLKLDLGAVAPASMDPEGLHSCLSNLVSNALDACLVSQNPSCTITLAVHDAADSLVFEVTDTGCGMDYEVKQRVFTSFFSTKGAGGTGLGLLLTRKIVQQHGGTVTFESTPGEGTRFRMVFPRQRLPRPQEEQ